MEALRTIVAGLRGVDAHQALPANELAAEHDDGHVLRDADAHRLGAEHGLLEVEPLEHLALEAHVQRRHAPAPDVHHEAGDLAELVTVLREDRLSDQVAVLHLRVVHRGPTIAQPGRAVPAPSPDERLRLSGRRERRRGSLGAP